MNGRAHYHLSARRHIRDIVHYVGEIAGSDQVGMALARRLREQCARLATLLGTLGRARPELGPELRSFPYRGYIIIFRYEKDGVTIVAILHASRDVIAYFGDDGPLA